MDQDAPIVEQGKVFAVADIIDPLTGERFRIKVFSKEIRIFPMGEFSLDTFMRIYEAISESIEIEPNLRHDY